MSACVVDNLPQQRRNPKGGGGRSGEECGRGVYGETRGPRKATKEVNSAGGCSEGGW